MKTKNLSKFGIKHSPDGIAKDYICRVESALDQFQRHSFILSIHGWNSS